MRRALIAIALGVSLLTPTQAQASDTHASGPCRGLPVRNLIVCAEHLFPVPGGVTKALSVAWCESHFDPQAISPSGKYHGVYQLGLSEFYTWGPAFPQMWNHWFSRPRNVHKARQNVLVAIRWVHRTQSWSPWACA